MNTTQFVRGFLWIKELAKTLFQFWAKNPDKSFSIVRFVYKKAIAFPRFFIKNTNTESTGKSYQNLLVETQELYKKLSKSSYKSLSIKLSSKSQILYFIVRNAKPNIVVETGVAAGESTGFILQALADNKKGKLYSIDLPFQWYVYGKNDELHLDSLPPGKMPGYLVPKKLKNRWKLILGDTYEKLPRLIKSLKQIDIFLHDSEHTDKTMTFEYNLAWPKIKKGGYLLSDDVDFTNAFKIFAKSQKTKVVIFKNLGIIRK